MNFFKQNFSALIIIFLLYSCSAHKETPVSQHTPSGPSQTKEFYSSYNSPKNQLSNKRKIIAHYAIKSLGTPYKWGGQSPKTGFDCSGLIVYTHKKADIATPRTAKAQFENGKVISKKDLQAADLVFFRNPYAIKTNHVGIYIGDGVFIHAPGKNRQITYGDMDNPYFKKNYLGSRTYL